MPEGKEDHALPEKSENGDALRGLPFGVSEIPVRVTIMSCAFLLCAFVGFTFTGAIVALETA